MSRPNTPEEREACINVIIDETRYRGRLTTRDVVNMFKLHRSTAEKYIREAVRKGNLIRHGRCGIFRDQRATIDFDYQRFTSKAPDSVPNPGAFMIMTNQQLIAAAEHAARYVPTATAQLITALAQAVQQGEATLSPALSDIITERQRQQSVEGWTPEHDDEHTGGELADAAACYAAANKWELGNQWPWAPEWWRPSPDPRRNLVKAGALIAAEIERIDRAASQSGEVQS